MKRVRADRNGIVYTERPVHQTAITPRSTGNSRNTYLSAAIQPGCGSKKKLISVC